MVTDEMLKRAIEAYAKDTGAEDWQLDGWINSAIRAALDAALSAAEPQTAPPVAVKALNTIEALVGNVEHKGGGANAARMYADMLNDIRSVVKSALSAQVQDVAGWERVTIETGRKSGTSHADVWPDGEGWEIDTDRGRINTPDAGWDRFSHHEELYFRRRASALPAAPAKQEG